MKVLIGADHGGYELKQELIAWMRAQGIDFLDYGTHSSDAVDYPDFALLVAQGVVSAPDEYVGIVIDGAGCGSAITANKVPGARAAACYCTFTAKNSRQHNAANVLSLGSKAVGAENRAFTLYSSATRQKAAASGVRTGLPSYSTVDRPLSSGA